MNRTVVTLALVSVVGLCAAAPGAAQAPSPSPAAAPAPAAAELAPAPEAPRMFYEGVRISFDGKTEAAGVVGIDVQPNGGALKRVWVRVLPKTDDSGLAEAVAKELTFALSTPYKVKASGGKVTISRASKSSAPVCVTVAGMSLYGVSVRVEQD